MTSFTRRTPILILVAAAALLLLQPAAANACSCLQPDIERDLPMADAAVVGTVGATTTDVGAVVSAVTEVDVEHVAKGRDIEVGSTLDVHNAGSSAACGLDMEPGQRLGLLLTRDDDGTWSSSLCQLVDPDELAAIEPVADHGAGTGLVARIAALLRALCSGSVGS